MIVEELINKLKEFPSNMRVLGRGYESGWEDLSEIKKSKVYHYPDNSWFEGKYQYEVNDFFGDPADKLTAVTIS